MRESVLALLFSLSVAPAAAQTGDHAGHGEHHSPYAGQEPSGIAALSLQEKEGLENGAGMGLARAAELNGYPGPKHVLELADDLGLSRDQLARVEAIHREMLADARRLGRRILDKESRLDRRFVHRDIDEDALRRLTSEIAALSGELRFAHLKAHLKVSSILSPEQIDTYVTLRGYRSDER